MSSSSIITQTVTAIIKAFSVPITAKRKMRADSFTLLLCTCFYSFTSTIRFSSSSCFWSITEGASSITSRPLLFLGECNAVADTVETCEDADPTVQTVCQTTVRRCTVFEGIHQEAELLLSLLRSESENLEHFWPATVHRGYGWNLHPLQYRCTPYRMHLHGQLPGLYPAKEYLRLSDE